MARVRGEASIGLSVIDRLIDEDLRLPEKQLTRSESLRKLRDAVRRDLEWLLNTRQPAQLPAEDSELANSLYLYGLPDISSMSSKDTRDQQRLVRAIQDAISKFEPRIASPRVTLLASGEEKLPVLRFLIEGMLRTDPNPENVSFDTVLELSSGEYKIQGDVRAR